MALVSVVPCGSYAPDLCRQALDQVLAPLGGLDFVQPGMRVAVKTNLVAAMKPETAAVTHPALLLALSQLILEKGATPVIGDSPGGLFTPGHLETVYRTAGLLPLEEAGAELNRDCSQKEAVFPEAVQAKDFRYTGWLDSCDVIINFCKLKAHGMMALSGAAKNLFGTVPGTLKPEYHFRFPEQDLFANMLVDLDEYWKPRLSIVDAVVAMEGNGPTAGTPRPIGCLLAGENPHALDLIGAQLMGLTPEDVPTLRAAIARGLCPAAPEELELAGDHTPFLVPDFVHVDTPNSLLFQDKLDGPAGKLLGAFIKKALASSPQVDKGECIGCAKCANICPAKAITMKRSKPVIRRKQCIRCFCCQEFCPKGAMKARRPAIASIINR